MNCVKKLIARFFSPRLGRLHEWSAPSLSCDEQGSCGKAQPKKYKDAIERHWAEEKECDDAMAKLAAGKGRFDF